MCLSEIFKLKKDNLEKANTIIGNYNDLKEITWNLKKRR